MVRNPSSQTARRIVYANRIQKKEKCIMNTGIVIARILFCGNVIGARAFPGMDEAREWARNVMRMGRNESDGPQFTVEYSM